MNKAVLIVEDEVLVGMMLARKLEANGYRVSEVVGTGEEVLDSVARDTPGAVLMDVSLGGGIDGIEAAEKIRNKYNLPVIFFTGYRCDDTLLAKAASVGGVAVIDKLGPIEKLLAVLEEIFQ